MFVRFSLSIVFIISSLLSISQNIDFYKKNFPDKLNELNKAVDNIFHGDEFYTDNFYAKALKYYLQANDFNPNSAILNYKIGNCYLNSDYKDKAKPFFEKAYKLKNNITPDIEFKLGQVNQLTYNFAKAINYYKKYLKSLSGKNTDKRKQIIVKKITECKNGILLIKNPVKGKIKLVEGINTEYAECRAFINADESKIFFTSRRKTLDKKVNPYNLQYYSDIYVSKKNDKGKWQSPKNIKNINTKRDDIVAGVLADGNTLFLSRSKTTSTGNIFVSYLQDTVWSKPQEMPNPISSKFKESSVCLSPDGNILYFVSNRPKGVGGKDIYYCKKEGNKWGKPKNLKALNTKYDEDALFMHPNGKTLYFSSKGYNTMGGYDIFVSHKNENGEWSAPKNMGYPINTPDNDLYFAMSADAKHGYFTINKNGNKDIYMIDFSGLKKTLQNNNNLTILTGIVKDINTKENLDVNIEITDNDKNEIISKFILSKNTDKYLVSLPAGKNYGFYISAENYLFYSDNFNLKKSQGYNKINKDIYLRPIKKDEKIILRNTFFNNTGDTLYSSSYTELDRLASMLKKYPKIKIEILVSSNNDKLLKASKKISKQMAKHIYLYLTAKGIKSRRLRYKGNTIAANNINESQDLKPQIEIKILK